MNGTDQEKNYKKQQDKRTKGIFIVLLVIVALLMFALGGSFAFFIATATSEEGAVKVASKGLQLEYVSEENLLNTDLIPADREVALYAATEQNDSTISNPENGANGLCKDDNGKSVCNIYNFTITNPETTNVEQTINIKLEAGMNQFANLQLIVIKPDDPDTILEELPLSQSQTTYLLNNLKATIAPGDSVSYQMIIWIENLDDEDQTEVDADKAFSGTIYVYPDDGEGQIKGVISAISQ